MPTPPVIDFDELLQPVSEDNPGGSAMSFMLRQELDDARKEENPDDYDADDPQRPEQATLADWAAIIRKASEALKTTGKDLQIAARLTEALTKHHGFAGLRDGFSLMNQMLQNLWDDLKPEIESEDDLEIRAAPFNWLDDPDRGAFYPLTIRQAPLIQGDGDFSWQYWHEAQSGGGARSMDAFERAISNSPYEKCQQMADDLKEALTILEELSQTLDERLGQVAPSMSAIVTATRDCQLLMSQIMERKGPSPDGPSDDEEGDASADGSSEGGGGGERKPRGQSRDDIYQTLAQAAAQLQRIEPHSPIPYLIQKAVSLGAMPFPALMKALIRDENVLSEMNREVGIPEEKQEEEY